MHTQQHDLTPRTPPAVLAARWLFYLMAAIWLVLALQSLARLPTNTTLPPVFLATIALMMIGNAGVLAWIGWGIGPHRRWFYYLGLAVLAVNILLTITDDFGILDLITLIIDLGLLVLLLVTRSYYTTARETP